MATPEEVSGSHALTTAEQLFCTLTAWHERVSVYVKGGVANVVGAQWRVYAINGSQRTLLFTGNSQTLLNEVVANGIPGQGDTIALYGLNPYGVTGSVKAYMVGWDPSAAVTPVQASDVEGITLDLTEQDVCDLPGGYVNLDVAFNANGDPFAALAQIRLYALLGGTDRFQLEQFQIPANPQGIPAVGSVNLLQNYMAGASEFILTAQGRYGTSAVTVTGTLEGETGSAGAGGGGGGSTLPNGTYGQTIVLTTEPNTYVAATINEGPYVTQATWFVDPVGGDDSANGLTSGTAIQTWAELIKRVPGGSRLQQSTTITFLSSQPDNSDPVEVNPAWTLPANSRLIVQGVPTMSAADTIGTATQIDPDTNQPYEITHTAPALDAASLLIDTTANAVAWTSDVLSSTDQRMAAFFSPLDPTTVSPFSLAFIDPSDGDSFEIATLPEIFVTSFLVVGGDGSGVVFYRLNINGANPENFSGGTHFELPIINSLFAECLFTSLAIYNLNDAVIYALNCCIGTADLSGLTILIGEWNLYGGSAFGEFQGSGSVDFRYMLSATTAGTIDAEGFVNPQCMWSFAESWLRHGSDIAAEIFDVSVAASGETYWAGATTEFGIALEDGSRIFCSFADPAADLASFLKGTSSFDISFQHGDHASTYDVASGRYVNSANGATGFTLLQTTVANGGWEGSAWSNISGCGWFTGNTYFSVINAPTGTESIPATKTADYAVAALDTVVVFDVTGGDAVCTLPATAIEGRPITVVVIAVGLATKLTIDGNGHTIGGAATVDMSTANTSYQLAFHGQWIIVGGKFS